MAFTVDTVLGLLRATVFHPVTSLLLPAGLIVSGAEPLPVKLGADIWKTTLNLPFSGRLKFSICCVGLSWALQLNRAWNRRALNPVLKDEYDWEREVVVVTGGSGGIGGELVRKLERLNTTVVVMDVIPLTYQPGPKTHYFKCDISNYEEVQQIAQTIAEKFGNPTVVVANAGLVVGKTILDATDRDLRRTFSVNVLGLLWSIKAFLPAITKANHGHILITSSATAFSSVCGIADYSASKAAVTGLYEGLQTELKHKYNSPRVRASAVFPATIATKMFEGLDEQSPFFMPLLKPEEVAERMFQILLKGESETAMMPALSNAFPWIRALPTWMRVAQQDVASDATNHLRKKG